MGYKYEFVQAKCWYKEVCPHYKCGERCGSLCSRYFLMHYLMNNSGLPYKQQLPKDLKPGKGDNKAFQELGRIKDNIVDFVSGGGNLYIHSSECGTGKTSWAVKLLTKYFDEIWPGNGLRVRGLFVNVPMFLSKTKSTISNKDEDFETMRERLLTTDLVVWDDIAATKLSEFDYNNILTYVDQRLFAGLSNIYTGNLGGDQIGDALGKRLASRIWNESEKVEFVGTDYRGSNT